MARVAGIDALRGFAVVQMIVYHFVYDLKYFGWITVDLTREAPWVIWRTAIVTQFLLLAGTGLALRGWLRPGVDAFWRRWMEVAGAALLVSAGSALVFGPRFIWFGILHFIALALVLARPLRPLGLLNLPLGAALVLAGTTLSHPAFAAPALSWIGFSPHRPPTEDFVPLVPWLGVVLIGVALGEAWCRRGLPVALSLERLAAQPPVALVALGRWSLTAYLVHQPVLMGVLWLVRAAGGSG